MSILGAMRSGVSGLFSQGAKFGAISDNISNSSTVGYKRSDVQFSTLVTGGTSENSYSPGGVRPAVRMDVLRSGNLVSSSSATDLAINGRGFFVVTDQAQTTGGTSYMLTRAGSFQPDENGDLVNAAGYYLQGFRLNPDGTPVVGTPSLDDFSDLTTVNVGSLNFVGSPTTAVDFAANLPAQLTGSANGPVSTTIQYYDPLGGTRRLTLEWQPDALVTSRWQLNVLDEGTSIGNVVVDFNTTGANAGSPASYAGSLTVVNGEIALSVNGGTQPLTLRIGELNSFDGIVQFNGDYSPSRMNKDGAKIGQLSRVEIAEDGILYAIFDNGLRQPAFQIPLADVPNANGLTAVDGDAFMLSSGSGDMRLWDAGTGPTGSVEGNALESSNVDIAEELTELITTQRAYSSNAKIIQTADEMLEETTRLKR